METDPSASEYEECMKELIDEFVPIIFGDSNTRDVKQLNELVLKNHPKSLPHRLACELTLRLLRNLILENSTLKLLYKNNCKFRT